MLRYRSLAAAALACCLAGCHPALRPAGGTARADSGREPRGARVYRIDAARSWLRVLVRRGGPMAALGHDHVITNGALGGWVALEDPLRASRFLVEVPVAAFVVDDEAARREQGGDFAAPVPADAKAATRAHMLGAALLDAAHDPMIVVRSLAVTGEGAGLRAELSIRIAGRDARIAAPFTLALDPHRLTADAAFSVRQTALGLTPYSVMLGALRVRDSIDVQVRVVAARR